jgi:hypothetical protein
MTNGLQNLKCNTTTPTYHHQTYSNGSTSCAPDPSPKPVCEAPKPACDVPKQECHDPCYDPSEKKGGLFGGLIGFIVAVIVIWIILYAFNPEFVQRKDQAGNPSGEVDHAMLLIYSIVIALIFGIIIAVLGSL